MVADRSSSHDFSPHNPSTSLAVYGPNGPLRTAAAHPLDRGAEFHLRGPQRTSDPLITICPQARSVTVRVNDLQNRGHETLSYAQSSDQALKLRLDHVNGYLRLQISPESERVGDLDPPTPEPQLRCSDASRSYGVFYTAGGDGDGGPLILWPRKEE